MGWCVSLNNNFLTLKITNELPNYVLNIINTKFFFFFFAYSIYVCDHVHRETGDWIV